MRSGPSDLFVWDCWMAFLTSSGVMAKVGSGVSFFMALSTLRLSLRVLCGTV